MQERRSANNRRRRGGWSRYYQSLRLMAADTDGGTDRGESVRERVCVCENADRQPRRRTPQWSGRRRDKGEVGTELIHPPSNTRTKTHPSQKKKKKKEVGMRNEQVQQFLCLLNQYACLIPPPPPPSLPKIDRNFSQGGKTSAPPAARFACPAFRSTSVTP